MNNPVADEIQFQKLDFAKIEDALHPAHITPSWMWRPSYDGEILPVLPSILPELPFLFSNYDPNDGLPKGDTVIRWLDATSGVEGVGVIALVAHALGIPDEEAAWRIAAAASLVDGKSIEDFMQRRRPAS